MKDKKLSDFTTKDIRDHVWNALIGLALGLGIIILICWLLS